MCTYSWPGTISSAYCPFPITVSVTNGDPYICVLALVYWLPWSSLSVWNTNVLKSHRFLGKSFPWVCSFCHFFSTWLPHTCFGWPISFVSDLCIVLHKGKWIFSYIPFLIQSKHIIDILYTSCSGLLFLLLWHQHHDQKELGEEMERFISSYTSRS